MQWHPNGLKMSRPCDYGRCDPERCTDEACTESDWDIPEPVNVPVTADLNKPIYSTLNLKYNGGKGAF
jgi:hypothetical protein